MDFLKESHKATLYRLLFPTDNNSIAILDPKTIGSEDSFGRDPLPHEFLLYVIAGLVSQEDLSQEFQVEFSKHLKEY